MAVGKNKCFYKWIAYYVTLKGNHVFSVLKVMYDLDLNGEILSLVNS